MVILVTGAKGQLGTALQKKAALNNDYRFIWADSQSLNLTDAAGIYHFFEQHAPDLCINTAAYTAVDLAETETEKAFAVNKKGVQYLAKACQKRNIPLIHISTDFVFDGQKTSPYTETDETHPLSVYGASKRAGEIELTETLAKHIIIRTSWVYSNEGKNFLKTMLRLADERDEIRVVNDQMGTPTHADDLAEVIFAFANALQTPNFSGYGIYHYSHEGLCSWFDFASEIMRVYRKNCVVKPIPTSDFPTPAKRPNYSVMDKSKIKSVLGIEIPDWRVALKHHAQ